MPDGSPDKKTSETITLEGLIASFENEKVVDYLLDTRTAGKLAAWIVEPLPIPDDIAKPLVRLALRFLTTLLLSKSSKGASWFGRKSLAIAKSGFEALPYSDKILEELSKLQIRLNTQAEAQAEMSALLAGSTASISEESATSFSEDTQLALRQLTDLSDFQDDMRGKFVGLSDALQVYFNPQPPLFLPYLEDDATTRLRFSARHIPFLGRDEEMEQLNAFRDSSERFSWWLMTGSGGLGKSRLALEFCLSAGTAWRVGFLSADSSFDKWETWQPDQPTLLVVDYVAVHAEKVGQILEQINRNRDLDCPVRVLLVERRKDKIWWDRMISSRTEGKAVEQKQFDGDNPLALSTLDSSALWQIVTTSLARMEHGKSDGLNQDEVLADLFKIDPGQRPLYAALAADALGADRALGGWDKERLLSDVIEREEENYWLPATRDRAGKLRPELLESHKNLLAFMTMVGGLPLDQIDKLPKSLGLPKEQDLCRPLYQAMSGARLTGLSLNEREDLELHGLTPDPLGEFFTLAHLEGKGLNGIRNYRRSAWKMPAQHPFNFAEFLMRSLSDFAGHNCLEYLVGSSPHTKYGRAAWSWLQTNRSWQRAEAGELDAARGFVDTLEQTVINHPEESFLRVLWAGAAFNMVTSYGEANKLGAASDLLKVMERAVHEHSEEQFLREEWAAAAFEMNAFYLEAGELSGASDLLSALEKVTYIYPTEPTLREAWSGSAFNMIKYYCDAGKLSEARGLLNVLEMATRTYPAEPILREGWARSAACMTFDYGSAGDLPDAIALLNVLNIATHKYPEEPVLREVWAIASVEVGRIYCDAEGMSVAYDFLNAIEKKTHKYPDEPILREAWARSALNMNIVLSKVGKLDAASGLLKILRAFIDTYPTEPILQETWARSASNMVTGYCKSGELNVARDLQGALKKITYIHTDEKVLHEEWAKATLTMTGFYGIAGNMSAAHDLHNALEEATHQYPDEPFLREAWALSVSVMASSYVTMEEPSAADNLVDALEVVALKYPNEPVLYERWIKLAVFRRNTPKASTHE